MLRKILIASVLLLLIVLSACSSDAPVKEEVVEAPVVVQEAAEPEPVVVEPTPEPIVIVPEIDPVNLSGEWKGTFTEMQILEICTIENKGTLTITFDMTGDTFTGLIYERGNSVVQTGSRACGGTYTIRANMNGKVTQGTKLSGTFDIETNTLKAHIPFTATVSDDENTMTAEFIGSGIEDKQDFTSTGTFTLTRQE